MNQMKVFRDIYNASFFFDYKKTANELIVILRKFVRCHVIGLTPRVSIQKKIIDSGLAFLYRKAE